MTSEMSGADGITSAEGRLLAMKLDYVSKDISDLKGTMASMATSLAALIKLEEQQKSFREGLSRAFEEVKVVNGKVEVLEGRADKVDAELPKYRDLRALIIRGMIATLVLIALAFLGQFIIDPMKRGWNMPPQMQKPSFYRAVD